MKRNKKMNIILTLMISLMFFICSSEIVLAQSNLFVLDDCSILSAEQSKFLQYIFVAIRVATPSLVLILIIKDFVQAVAAQKDDDIKKAQAAAIKRLIIGVIIMFVPTIVNLILDLMGQGLSTCGLG